MLYLRFSKLEASPKAISGRTSYLQARLEFHRYPQVIPALFNVRGFGPPRNFTFASTCSWIGRLVSGLRRVTGRPFKTRFRYGSGFSTLTLHVIMTRRFILQEARRHPLTGSDSL